MKPSHLRQRLWSQPPIIARSLYPVSRPVYSEASRCAFSQIKPALARRQMLRVPTGRAFASRSILISEVNSVATLTSWRTTPHTFNGGKNRYSITPASRPISSLAQKSWRAGIYSKSQSQIREKELSKRNKSSTSKSGNEQKPAKDDSQPPPVPPEAKKEEPPHPDSSPSNKYLHLSHLPRMPHRPSKEELLAAATGFWSRLTVRFKWFSIRSVRPWNVDDWSAFVSWFVLGNIVWILVGTTTFFSLVILSINTVVAQGTWLIMEKKNTMINCDYRNVGQMGRRLSNAFRWYKGCFRVSHCSKMGRWSYNIPQRLCVEETRTGQI